MKVIRMMELQNDTWTILRLKIFKGNDERDNRISRCLEVSERVQMYPVHRQRFPSKDCSTVLASGVGSLASMAYACITHPGVQYPHWVALPVAIAVCKEQEEEYDVGTRCPRRVR